MTELTRQALHKRPQHEMAQPESHLRTPDTLRRKPRTANKAAHYRPIIRRTIMHDNIGMLVSAQEQPTTGTKRAFPPESTGGSACGFWRSNKHRNGLASNLCLQTDDRLAILHTESARS
ncbi:hypothetical protein E2P81_ATG10519 [Venturia nashicola]|nr:hypothetical protein E2P81_ATG10519 [Venturia nashicola]